jgi:VanZ family protein
VSTSENVAPESARRRPGHLSAWLPALAWAAGLFVASALPGGTARVPSFFAADKLIHCAAYLGLGFLCARGCHRSLGGAAPRRAGLWGAGLASLYGATDELHQLFVPDRSADVLDLGADALGAAIGAALFLLTARWRFLVR